MKVDSSPTVVSYLCVAAVVAALRGKAASGSTLRLQLIEQR